MRHNTFEIETPTGRDGEAFLAEIAALREARGLREAIHQLSAIFAEDIHDAAVASLLAIYLSDDAQYDRAGRLFQHVVTLDGDHVASLLNYGTFLASTGRVAEGRRILETTRERIQTRIAEAGLRRDHSINAADEMSRFQLCTLNLAEACVETDDMDQALVLVTPLLTDDEVWVWWRATDIINGILRERGDKPLDFAQARFDAHEASGPMVLYLVEALRGGDEDVFIEHDVLKRILEVLLETRVFLGPEPLAEIFAPESPGGDFIVDIAKRLAPFALKGDRLSFVLASRFVDAFFPIYGEELRDFTQGMTDRDAGEARGAADEDRQAWDPGHAADVTWKVPRERRPAQQMSFHFGSADLPLWAPGAGATRSETGAAMTSTARLRVAAEIEELRQARGLKAAIARVSRRLAQGVHHLEVALSLAMLLADDGQYDRAERLFRHAQGLPGPGPRTLFAYGISLLSSDRILEGRDMLEALRERIRARLNDAKQGRDTKASGPNNLPISRPIHPVWPCCSSVEYVKYSSSSRLARRAPRTRAWTTNFDQTPDVDMALELAKLNQCSLWLAVASLRMRDADEAIALATPLLTHRDARIWRRATAIVHDAVVLRGGDPLAFAKERFQAHEASPSMVFDLIEELRREQDDVSIEDRLLERNAYVLLEASKFLWPEALREVFAMGTRGADFVVDAGRSLWTTLVSWDAFPSEIFYAFFEAFTPVYGGNLMAIVKEKGAWFEDDMPDEPRRDDEEQIATGCDDELREEARARALSGRQESFAFGNAGLPLLSAADGDPTQR